MQFDYYLYGGYALLGIVSYPYLKLSYFPRNASKLEKSVTAIMAFCWLVSVPITLILKQDDEGEEL